MNGFIFKTAAVLLLGLVFTTEVPAQTFTKTRLVMMADMNNEPDEMQQNAHLFMYANEIDFEGLYAVTGSCRKNQVDPWMYDSLVKGYARVLPNLKKHASGWPDSAYLSGLVKGGYPAYGTTAIGQGKSSPASNHLKGVLTKNDPRPVYIVVNAGSYTLGQALYEQNLIHTKGWMDTLCEKIIVYENAAQDDAGAWIMLRYPKIRWYRSQYQTNAYAGGSTPYTWEPFSKDGDGQHTWAINHIMTNHGALGAKYPDRRTMHPGSTIEGGGTSPWIGLANHGLFDPEKLYWGGWGGRFSRVLHSTANDTNVWSRFAIPTIRQQEESQVTAMGHDFSMYLADCESDTWYDPVNKATYSGRGTCVNRWRRACFNDFRGRMDWCVKEYAQANHNPVAAVDGDTSDNIIIKNNVVAGQSLTLSAAGTKDPDGDPLKYNWYVYKEAGTYPGTITITNPTSQTITFTIPADANKSEIHVILEVNDSSKVYDTSGRLSMYDYRRIVLNVGYATGVLNSNTNMHIPNRSATIFTAGDQLVLPADFRDRECRLAVFDIAGKCVKRAVVKARIVSISKQFSLTPGAYLVKIAPVR